MYTLLYAVLQIYAVNHTNKCFNFGNTVINLDESRLYSNLAYEKKTCFLRPTRTGEADRTVDPAIA